jgi:hypothetical protein
MAPARDSVPFSSGPFKGRFLCGDCWTLELERRPGDLADRESVAYVADEARRIRQRRRETQGSAPLHSGASARAFLTPKGTVIIDVDRAPGLGPDEYDAARLAELVRALRAVAGGAPDLAASWRD